ncbi:MAG TPA: hypothetical protein VIB39_05975 [Candidatus Angelobacter sp.]|jgi:hypothetical protein
MFQVRVAVTVLACLSVCYGQQPASKPRPPQSVKHAPAAGASGCDTTTTPPPESSFPKGFDYPEQVQGWVYPTNGDRMRLHGWCLFAGLNQVSQPNGPLLWQNWKTSTQAFQYQYNPWKGVGGAALPQRPAPLNARNVANARVGGANPINNPPPMYPINSNVANKYPTCRQPIPGHSGWYQLMDGDHMQSNGDIMVAGVIYNKAAIDNIVLSHFDNAVTLNSLLPPDKTSPANAIKQFPSSSIVLKPMFWPVQKGGFTVLPVWDWDANKPGSPTDGQYAGYEMKQFWRNAVAITDLPNPTPPPKVTYLYNVYDPTGTTQIGPITYDNTSQISPPAFRVVSVNDFYHRQLNATELAQLSTCDRALLDASAYWAYNRAFQPGDYIVLVAMHIMTKEQPDWTFQSLWYHPDADKSDTCRYCKSRPTNLADTTFRHYLLTTTYGTTQGQGHDNYYAPPNTQPGASIWPVAYNPYIELAASHPITTNCMNCHHRAAWPPLASQNKPDQGRTSSYLQDSPPNPNALEVFQENNSIFNGLLTVDAMWAVSDRAGYPTSAKPGAKKTSPEKKSPPKK